MYLLFLRYKSTKGEISNILLFPIGEREGRICGLNTAYVTDAERERLLSIASVFDDKTSLDRWLTWLKTNCPMSYDAAYRELPISNVQLLSKHPVLTARPEHAQKLTTPESS